MDEKNTELLSFFNVSSPFYKKEDKQYMKLIAIMCCALSHKFTIAVKISYMKLFMRIVDTDIDVVAIATINNITPYGLWVAFGSECISCCNLCNIASTLPLFHALGGCDTKSSFAGIGNKTVLVKLDVKGKCSFYKAQCPVRWTAQSVLHFLPSLADLFIPTPTLLLREAFYTGSNYAPRLNHSHVHHCL